MLGLSVLSASLPPMDCSLPGSTVRGVSPGKNTGVGCHALLQGIFPTQGWNSSLPRCRRILYCLSHQGRLGVLKNSLKKFWKSSDLLKNSRKLRSTGLKEKDDILSMVSKEDLKYVISLSINDINCTQKF